MLRSYIDQQPVDGVAASRLLNLVIIDLNKREIPLKVDLKNH